MARTIHKHKLWLIPPCVLLAVVMLLCGWQQLQAQNANPGMPGPVQPPGAPGATPGMPAPAMPVAPVPGTIAGAPGTTGAPDATGMIIGAAAAPSEPTFSLGSMLPPGVKVMTVKNWDGGVTQLLRFKHKTMNDNTITVHLPASYKSEKRTKASWDTLFYTFSMDREASLDAARKKIEPDLSVFANQLAAELASSAPRNDVFRAFANANAVPAPGSEMNPAAAAMDYARSSLPSMGMQLPPLAPALPSMSPF